MFPFNDKGSVSSKPVLPPSKCILGNKVVLDLQLEPCLSYGRRDPVGNDPLRCTALVIASYLEPQLLAPGDKVFLSLPVFSMTKADSAGSEQVLGDILMQTTATPVLLTVAGKYFPRSDFYLSIPAAAATTKGLVHCAHQLSGDQKTGYVMFKNDIYK
ncbi:MAG: hypothetical protein RLZ12_996 [Bacillota bacterium]